MMKPSDIRHLALLAASLLATTALAQVAQPSNSTTDLYPIATSPRFLLNGTEFPHLAPISLAPLGPYASITKSDFLDVSISERLINVDASNSDQPLNNQIAYISCDPQAYNGYITASQVFDNVLTLAASDSPNSLIIVYSVYSNHCNVSDLSNSPQINGVLTTVDPVAAAALAKLNLSSSSKGSALILPDLKSYTNASSNGQSGGSNLLGPSPTTAVAMIILYSITGIITALFIIIIITGAIRAHRHPERYGPRNIIGRPRQSRAKGIARAMLETLPIVKFGDHDDVPVKPGSSDGTAAVGAAGTDIEMNPTTTHDATRTKSPADEADADADAGTEQKDMHHGDGTQEDGSLGCSICTEDFTRGEEVRVLPCNHKFHPDCVDPWLLNVSGTCPLCRINLQPKTEEADAEAEPEANSGSAVPGEEGPIRGREGDDLPPPLALNALEGNAFSQTGGSNRHGSLSLGLTSGTREERLAALRRLRADRRERTRNHAAANENGDVLGEGAGAPEVQTEAERRGLTARLRDRFRIRTRTVSDGEWRNRGARAENGIGARSIVTLNRHAR